KIPENLVSHDRIVILGGGNETAYGSYCGLARHFPDQKSSRPNRTSSSCYLAGMWTTRSSSLHKNAGNK
ncbi:MAG: hypothetical protein L3J05_00665, partial [Robiginitomaculum sp.]|nr:hypothetical protein [Robiginitomaculum sp.]